MFKIPNSSQRVTIMGRTGSGKTVAAIWNLSIRPLRSKIWIVMNHKGDETIDSIENAQHVDLDFFPKKPGLYIYHPLPGIDDDAVTNILWAIHRRGNIGLYIDEGYMIHRNNPALNALYTQGRSKNIPVITLTQRPVGMSRFAISEADFLQIFYLTDKRDRELVGGFTPFDLNDWMSTEANEPSLLPEYHSLWYDVSANKVMMIQPVPRKEELVRAIDEKIYIKKRTFI